MAYGPAPLLIIRRPDAHQVELEWVAEAITLGRESANDIVIDHPLASRRHARLERSDDGFLIRDLGSTNGTQVNDIPLVDACPLHNQDRIWIADTEIIFNDPEATQKGMLPVELLRRVRASDELLRIDGRSKEVFVAGKLLDPPLTVKEFHLLELLNTNRGQVLSKDEIARNVWDYEVYDYNAIDALIYRLRQRIEADPGNPRFVVTVRGFGYKLVVDP